MGRRLLYLVSVILVLSIVDISSAELIAHWKLDEDTGTTPFDSTGNGNDGILQGNPEWIPGKLGGALDFDGDGDFIDCGNNELFNVVDELTVSAWIYMRTISGDWRTIIAKGDSAWRLSTNGSTQGMHFSFTGEERNYQRVNSITEIPFNEWHHVCGVYDRENGARIYIDGKFEAVNPDTGGIDLNTYNVYIGENEQSPGRFWDGLIDDVRVYNHALTEEEIQSSMQDMGVSPPKLDLTLEFIDTFDDPASPGWDVSDGAAVVDGILYLEQEGAHASLAGEWYNYTIQVLMRRTGPGAVGINLTEPAGDIVRLVLSGESIDAKRMLPGSAVDMIIERHIQEPPELPVGEWFSLQITQLDGLIIVGVDGVRLCDLYDPNPGPLPPSGLTLAAMGDTLIEIDTVAVIPWAMEYFDEPLSATWDLSAVDTTTSTQDGKLIIHPGEFAVRMGQWEEMTFSTRIRRDRLVNAALTYPGYVLELRENFISLLGESEGQLHELAGAPLPEFPTEPETTKWMDVTVVIRNGEHHVLAYGIELFSIIGEVITGAVSAEAFEGDLVLDRLMIGPPLPLWPFSEIPPEPPIEPDDAEPDSEPDSEPDAEPDDEEDGGSSPSEPSADLAVTDIFPDSLPNGNVYCRITNNGPDTLQNVTVNLITYRTFSPDPQQFGTDYAARQLSVTLQPGETGIFDTGWGVTTSLYPIEFVCDISSSVQDPDTSNNSYTEIIDTTQ